VPKETKINITNENLTVYNKSNEIYWKVKSVFVGRRFEPSTPITTLKNLTNTDQVGIYYEGKKVDLPKNILEKLIKYFKQRPNQNTNFDCSSFAHFLNDIPYQFPNFYKNNWIFEKLTTHDLLAGDTIIISSVGNENDFVHLAIYINNGIYLSKFGNSGNLIFATLEEMKKGFGGQTSFKITPNK
jgi:hypothetical protein